MKKILIAEDHPIMSAGTCQMLRNYMPDAQITEVDTFRKAIQEAESTEFDLIIMDIGIPGGDSVQMVERFRYRWPSVPILMFSAYDENLYAVPFVKAGANGFISKKAKESEFRLAVETVLFRNKIYLSEEIREWSLNMYIKSGRSHQDLMASLSTREKEIVHLFLARKGVSEIGSILNLSTSTINTHRVRIFKKMGVENMIDLVRKFEMLNQEG